MSTVVEIPVGQHISDKSRDKKDIDKDLSETDKPCAGKDIEKGLSENKENENETNADQPPLEGAYCAVSFLWFLTSFLVTMVSMCVGSPPNMVLVLMGAIVLVDSWFIGNIFIVPRWICPTFPWHWILFFIFLYHHLSTLVLAAIIGLLPRGYKVF